MKRRLMLTALLVLALTLFAFPMPARADGNTYYVATNGDNSDGSTWANAYTTIQAAINAAGSNDTIMVGSSGTGHGTGTYTENVNVNKQLTIQSENGYGSTTVVAASSSDHVFEVTADYVTIEGFTIYGATDTYKAGIKLYYADHCNISNNRCGYDDSHENYYGIEAYYSKYNTISSNTCNANNSAGIGLSYSSDNNTVSGNTCNSNAYQNISVQGSTNSVSGNTCNSGGQEGILLTGSGNNVSGNTCNSNSWAGIRLTGGASNNTLVGNTFNLNNSYGIYFWTLDKWK